MGGNTGGDVSSKLRESAISDSSGQGTKELDNTGIAFNFANIQLNKIDEYQNEDGSRHENDQKTTLSPTLRDDELNTGRNPILNSMNSDRSP